MKLAIVAYPTLDEADRQWIELFRAEHDPQASRIGAHFTLVFPTEANPDDLDPDIAEAASSIQPISFAIGSTKVVQDVLSDASHIFLVPDHGGIELTTLHDRLYGGVLRRELRSDILFVPHITVGAATNSQVAEELAARLSSRFRVVRGTVSGIELVDVGTRQVQSVATYTLGNAATTTAHKSK